MENVKQETTGTRELYKGLQDPSYVRNFVSEAYARGMNLSQYLEEVSPSESGDQNDAFERLLIEAGIVVRSNPASGYWASKAEDFLSNSANRVLLTEFFSRIWRGVAFAQSAQDRAIYLSSDGTPGSFERPYAEAAARWSQQLAPAIPLSEVVAMTTPIDGQDYRQFYLTYSAENLRLFRTGESADIPIAKVADAEYTINLKKYGRGLLASYEQLRRMRVDKLAMQIAFMAIQSEVDKLAAAITILLNGDGNQTGTTWDHNGDFSGTLQTLDLNSWLNFKKKFANPYVMTTALMTEAISLQLEQLNTGSANVALSVAQIPGSGSITAINSTSDGVRYGWDSNVSTWIIIGIDKRFALEQIVEIGGQVDEMERFITNQTQLMTMTEVQGFAVLDSTAIQLLDLND